MEYTGYNKQRKPNLKKWSSPFEDKEINSSGVPAYVRNKLKLPWKPEYMTDRELLLKDFKKKAYYDSILLNMKKFGKAIILFSKATLNLSKPFWAVRSSILPARTSMNRVLPVHHSL